MTTSKFCYVYFLSDIATGTHHYVGHTSLKPAERLAVHNSGAVPHTSKYRPWRITAAIAVESERTAIELESYFKTHSGRAFANKHLFPSSWKSKAIQVPHPSNQSNGSPLRDTEGGARVGAGLLGTLCLQ